MRVGEHKTKKINEWKQTQHFRVGDVRLWNNNKMVSHYEPMEELLQSEIATLNQILRRMEYVAHLYITPR